MPRVRLRELVTSIEKRKRRVVYTDFEDEIGLGRTIDFAGFDGGPDYERFLRKVRAYVIERKDTVSLRKVSNNFALTETDLLIDHLAANGIVPAARFYESPFTDLSATGPDGLCTS